MASTSQADSTPTFHGFLKLPPEIRIKIWKAACFPRTDNDHGLQYATVDFVNRVDGYIILRAMKLKKKTPFNGSNMQSAYVWDAGLWRACHESRDVMTKNLAIGKWQHPPNASPCYCSKFPSCLMPHKLNNLWRPIVVPRSDIFCIDASHLCSIPRSLYDMKLIAPLLDRRGFTLIQDWNVAFKFDSSWNANFPQCLGQLLRENSQRGLLMNWIERFAQAVYPEPTLWIIDDTASWVTIPGFECKTVYRDCGVEYVQSHWSALRGQRGKQGRYDVDIFISSFGELMGDDIEGWFSVEDHIRLLVRKENEVPDSSVVEHENRD